jgi:subtilisin family serine protease
MLLGLLACLALSTSAARAAAGKPERFVARQLVVDASVPLSPGDVHSLLKRWNATIKARSARGELLLLDCGDANLDALAAGIRTDPRVVSVSKNYLYTLDVVPNDTFFPNQHSLRNTGQYGGTPNDDIHATAAWDVTTGSSSVVVGILDSGVEYTHPDLAANLWTNPGEIPGNGIDDDNDNLVDDVHGWDFIDGDNAPLDPYGHGTEVAGVIAAKGNNGIGIAGVAWNVRYVPLRVANASGGVDVFRTADALDYAIAKHFPILNASFSGPDDAPALALRVQNANNAGILIVAAAGNDHVNLDDGSHHAYPASYTADNVVAVANCDVNDNLASSSNYGATSVDIAAPGTQITTTDIGSNYGVLADGGTSMATPHVAGALALMLSRFPTIGARDAKKLLLSTVDARSALAGMVLTGGRLNALGCVTEPSLSATFLSPTTAQHWHAGSNHPVTWTSDWPAVPYLQLTPTGDAYGPIGPAGLGSSTATTPANLNAFAGVLRLQLAWGTSLSDASVPITIVESPSLQWVYEPIDGPGRGQYPSIVLDASGNPRISYFDQTGGHLYYAVRTGSGWTTTLVDDNGRCGLGTSLALTSAGEPCISYVERTSFLSGHLRFAYHDGAGWHREDIAPIGAPDVGERTVLALDASGAPRIAFYDGNQVPNSYCVRVASRGAPGSPWTFDTPEPGSMEWSGFDMVLDSAGNPRLAMIRFGTIWSGQLGYFEKTGTPLHWTTAELGGTTTGMPALVADDGGNPIVILGQNAAPAVIQYKRSGGSWTLSPVDQERGAVSAVEAVRTSTGFLSATYWTSGVLMHASLQSGVWSVAPVDTLDGGTPSSLPTIALDPSGHPFFGYLGPTSGLLKLASLPPPGGGDPGDGGGDDPPMQHARIEVFPNPVKQNGELACTLMLARSERVSITLYDVAGGRVESNGAEILPPGRATVRVSLHGKPPGLYFLGISRENGQKQTMRVAVVR